MLDIGRGEIGAGLDWEDNGTVNVPSVELYDLYQHWCKTGGEVERITLRSFPKKMKAIGFIKQVIRFDGFPRKGYYINRIAILESLRILTNNPDLFY